jgi:hypothetical protein
VDYILYVTKIYDKHIQNISCSINLAEKIFAFFPQNKHTSVAQLWLDMIEMFFE